MPNAFPKTGKNEEYVGMDVGGWVGVESQAAGILLWWLQLPWQYRKQGDSREWVRGNVGGWKGGTQCEIVVWEREGYYHRLLGVSKGPLELNDHGFKITPVNTTVCFPIFVFHLHLVQKWSGETFNLTRLCFCSEQMWKYKKDRLLRFCPRNWLE